MPRNYRPRPHQTRQCEHCQTSFITNHARTKYCGDSCRVRAFYARQNHPSKLAQVAPTTQEPVEAQLALSWTNLGVGALSSSVVAFFNHFLHDSPAHQELLRLLRSIEAGQARLQFTKVNQDLNYLVDYVATQVDSDVTLGPRMQQARQARLKHKQSSDLKRLSS